MAEWCYYIVIDNKGGHKMKKSNVLRMRITKEQISENEKIKGNNKNNVVSLTAYRAAKITNKAS